MRYRVAYDKALETSKDMGESLLQRVNFFLIGTAFLIAGLAALVASSNDGGLAGYRLNLAYTINALGLYLALFFAVINSLTMAVLADFGKYVKEELEQELMAGRGAQTITGAPPFTKAEEITNLKMQCFPWKLLANPFRQLYLLFADSRQAVKEAKTHHALLLPVLFVVGWIAIFELALPHSRMATALVYGLIGLIPTICAAVQLIRYLRGREWKVPEIPRCVKRRKPKPERR
jgi:hypothetical protein